MGYMQGGYIGANHEENAADLMGVGGKHVSLNFSKTVPL